MKLRDIAKMPTVVTRLQMKQLMQSGCTGVHESMFRSWHVLERVKVYLRSDTPADVILELIEVMDTDFEQLMRAHCGRPVQPDPRKDRPLGDSRIGGTDMETTGAGRPDESTEGGTA